MVDGVLLNKAATVERCVARASEEYRKTPATLSFCASAPSTQLTVAPVRWPN